MKTILLIFLAMIVSVQSKAFDAVSGSAINAYANTLIMPGRELNNETWAITNVYIQYPQTNLYPMTDNVFISVPSDFANVLVDRNITNYGGYFDLGVYADYDAQVIWNDEHGGLLNNVITSSFYTVFTNPTPNITNTFTVNFSIKVTNDIPVGVRDGSFEDNCFLQTTLRLNYNDNFNELVFSTNLISGDLFSGSMSFSTSNSTLAGYFELLGWGAFRPDQSTHSARIVGLFSWSNH